MPCMHNIVCPFIEPHDPIWNDILYKIIWCKYILCRWWRKLLLFRGKVNCMLTDAWNVASIFCVLHLWPPANSLFLLIFYVVVCVMDHLLNIVLYKFALSCGHFWQWVQAALVPNQIVLLRIIIRRRYIYICVCHIFIVLRQGPL